MAELVKVEGLAELERALAELPKATAANVLRRVLKKHAEPVAERWKQKEARLTGHLQESTIVGTRLTRRQARERREDGKDFVEVYVGTADPAGMQEEFGNVHQPAHPAGRPAWDESKDKVLEGIAKDLGDEIEKARARLARKAARLAR